MSNDFTSLLRQLRRDDAPIRLAWATAADGFRTVLLADEVEAESLLEWLNQQGADVWWEVQPSAYDGGARSSAQHVTAVRVLYADLDYKPKPQGLGSLPEAMDVVTDLEGALGVPAAAIVHSGHGIQPYWLFDGGDIATEDDRSRMALLLRRWGLMVSTFAGNQHGGVDNVYDLPRILRVPGSINHKSDPVPVTVELRERPIALDLDDLTQAFEDYDIPVPTSDHLATAAAIVSSHADWNWAEQDCGFVATVREEIRTSVPASRHHWALKWAAILFGMVRSGCVTEATHEELTTLLVTRFTWLVESQGTVRQVQRREVAGIMRAGLAKAESWDTVKLAEEMRQHLHADAFAAMVEEQAPSPMAATSHQVTASAPAPEPAAPNPGGAGDVPVPSIFAAPVDDAQARADEYLRRQSAASGTDVGNSALLAHHLDGRYVHVATLGWHRWNGHRWQADESGQVMEEAKRLAIRMFETAQDTDQTKWARATMSGGRLKTMIDLARTEASLVVEPSSLDTDAESLNTPAGVVDLRTGVLRASDPRRDRMTLATNLAPVPGETPRFDAFMRWAMADDLEKVAYLQRVFGAALIGDLRWHILPLFVGSGGNGKSVVFDLAHRLLGMYSHILPRKFFVEKRSDQHPTEIAELRGKRLAIASEVPPGARFDEDLVKLVTGEGVLKGRFMAKDFFEFRNTATFLLAVNHLPTVSAGGQGFWRRVRKVDFTQSMPEERQNPYLVTEMVEAEGPAMLAWMIEGARQVIAHGLQDPRSVMEATREYRMQEDAIGRFIDDQLTLTEAASVSQDAVYNRYQGWCIANGIRALSKLLFERELKQALPGVGDVQGIFQGIALPMQFADEGVTA